MSTVCGGTPHRPEQSLPHTAIRIYAPGVPDLDDSPEPAPTTWTTRYRIPIAIGTGFLALLCCWSLFSGGTTERWIGGIGLVVLVGWVVAFRTLYRRGY